MTDPTRQEGTDPNEETLDAEALSVNELSRFTKSSTRLVLEQYSHCEVPAGCGGVVLRWVNPDSPVPFGCHAFGPPYCNALFVDGVEHRTSQVMLTAGEHVLVFAMSIGRGEGDAFMAVASTAFGSVHRTGSQLPEVTVASSADGSWLIATSRPSQEALTARTPDPSVWSTPTGRPRPARPSGYAGYYDECAEHGAEALALPSHSAGFWVRVVVEVPHHPDSEENAP